jgi:branched-chain amino acid transport system ATP-binding protein
MALLSVRDVTLRFGGIVALDGVSFDVEEGHISGLIGPNGAGKTTAFNVITRLYKPDAGAVDFDGGSLLHASPHTIVRKGIARTFQNIQLFRTMSVLENVLIGAHSLGRTAGEEEAFQALDVVGLRERAYFPAAALPYGIQKRVELARALVAKPRLLLLDEPAGGLNHEEVAELGTFIRKIRDDFELTVLLVEHHMNLVMSISDHVNVLSFGRKIADGPPEQVRADAAVIEAYLGSDDSSPPPAPAAPEPEAAPDPEEPA